MMRLLFLILILFPNVIHATEVATVATTTAPQAMTLSQLVTNALFAVVSALMIFLTNYAKAYLVNKTKKANHERGASVVGDSFYSTIATLDIDIDTTLKDATSKKAFLESWLNIAIVRLNDLSDFKKKDLKAWIEVQQLIFLGKYLENRKVK